MRLRLSLLSFLCLLPAFPQVARAQLDSALTAALESHLEEYFDALDREPVQVKLEECDFMIGSCEDSLARQYIAVRIFDHFLGSKIMGDETVAVHMVDDWFVPGKVSMYNDLDLLNARVYADFHRNSLIGKKAPVLELQDASGNRETLPREGEISVLFFYDTSCAKCKVETLLLRSVLSELTGPVEFYAVYSGVHKEQWQEFVSARWDFEAPNVTFHHLWDPELESDFQRQYGVLQTPQMLLVDESGVIVGRGLDSQALQTLLTMMLPQPYDYGTEESMDLFRLVFEDDSPTAARLLETADYVRTSTLSQGDSTLCAHMLGDYMCYLLTTPGEEYKLALESFLDIYVDGMPEIWSGVRRSAQLEGLSLIARDLLGRTPVGSRLPDLTVKGCLYGTDRLKTWRLRRLKGSPSYIMFADPDCSSCKAEKQAAGDYLAGNRRARVLVVDPADNGNEIFDLFDLTTLPFIIQTDRRGRVIRRYISFLDID